MELMDAIRCADPSANQSDFSDDLRTVLKILSEHGGAGAERRKFCRCAYHVHATLEIIDPLGHAHRHPIVTRDANQWGIGFITQTVLPVGSNAVIEVKGGLGAIIRPRGGIVRSREALPGWFEGAILFEQEQPPLSPEAIQGLTSLPRPSKS